MKWQAIHADGSSVWDLDETGFDRIDRSQLVRFKLWPENAIVPLIDIDIPSGSTFLARRTNNAYTGSWIVKVGIERDGMVDVWVFEPPSEAYRLDRWGFDRQGNPNPWLARPIPSEAEAVVSA